MSPRFEVEAIWRERAESIDACAERAVELMKRLGKIDPALATLGWADYSRQAAFNLLAPSVAALRERMDLGRHRADHDRRLIEDLGFSTELVTPTRSQARIRIDIDCGRFAPGFSNSVKIAFADWSPNATQFCLLSALDAAMTAWDAELGSVLVSGLESAFPFVQGSIAMGSILWLPVPPRDLPPLPAGVRVEPRGERGSLVVLTEERFDRDNPAHVALARGAHAALSGAGLLRIWPPR